MATDTRAEAKIKSFGVNIESDLALEFLRVVEKAAIASARTMGQGDRPHHAQLLGHARLSADHPSRRRPSRRHRAHRSSRSLQRRLSRLRLEAVPLRGREDLLRLKRAATRYPGASGVVNSGLTGRYRAT